MQAVRPHLGAIAAKMEEMWAANQLSVSERNVLCDSMLAAAASGGPTLHTQVSLHSPNTSNAMQPRHQGTYNLRAKRVSSSSDELKCWKGKSSSVALCGL